MLRSTQDQGTPNDIWIQEDVQTSTQALELDRFPKITCSTCRIEQQQQGWIWKNQIGCNMSLLGNSLANETTDSSLTQWFSHLPSVIPKCDGVWSSPNLQIPSRESWTVFTNHRTERLTQYHTGWYTIYTEVCRMNYAQIKHSLITNTSWQ